MWALSNRKAVTAMLICFARRTLFIVLGLLSIAWIASILLICLTPSKPLISTTNRRPLLAQHWPMASWRDTLVLDLAIGDRGVQQRHGTIVWGHDRHLYQLPLHALADGRIHRYVIPVGAHPEWRGTIGDLRLYFPQPAELKMVSAAQLIRRPPWALEQLFLRMLFSLLIAAPPWEHVALAFAGLLGIGLALLCPIGAMRRRLVIVAVLLGIAGGTPAVWQQLKLTSALPLAYAHLDEVAAARLAPAYNEPAEINTALVDLASRLPTGPVLLFDQDARSYLAYRSRYLFYPRRIDVTTERLRPAVVAEVLRRGYTSIIGRGQAPALPAGWQRLDAPGGLTVLTVPGTPPPAPTAATGPLAWLGLLGGLVLVASLGWSIAGLFGLRGGERLAGAWVLGTSATAWWMVALVWLGGAWSWWSVGGPLGALATILGVYASRRAAPIEHAPAELSSACASWGSRLSIYGAWLLLLVLFGSVTVHSTLLPFTDQDTWSLWGLRGRAFYLDQALHPLLLMYRGQDLHQPAYPPAHSLLQTWGYLAMGGLNERLVKLIFPIWYAVLVGLVGLICRRWGSQRQALGWALLMATTPLLLDHATLGNADLPLAVAWLVGVVSLCRWIESSRRRWLLYGAVALAGGAWIKLDGLYFGVYAIGAAALLKSWLARRFAEGLGPGLAALAIVLALTLPWPIYAASLGIGSPELNLALWQAAGANPLREGALTIVEELIFSHNNSAWGLLGGGFGALWLISLGALALNWRRLRHDPLLALLVLTVLGGIVFYLIIYALRPYASVERYLLHLAPLAVVAAARSLCTGAVAVTIGAGRSISRPLGRPIESPMPSADGAPVLATSKEHSYV
jgi:4-amino-4-deoxy-L-arabinose transferase-like glycosyltransferase